MTVIFLTPLLAHNFTSGTPPANNRYLVNKWGGALLNVLIGYFLEVSTSDKVHVDTSQMQ